MKLPLSFFIHIFNLKRNSGERDLYAKQADIESENLHLLREQLKKEQSTTAVGEIKGLVDDDMSVHIDGAEKLITEKQELVRVKQANNLLLKDIFDAKKEMKTMIEQLVTYRKSDGEALHLAEEEVTAAEQDVKSNEENPNALPDMIGDIDRIQVESARLMASNKKLLMTLMDLQKNLLRLRDDVEAPN